MAKVIFKSYNPNDSLLLPPCLGDYLPGNHPARVVSAIIDRLDISEIDASYNLGIFDLSGAVLYTTGEPCHMCLCACLWANIEKVYYGCTIEDNGLIGFRDDKFDNLFGGREKLGVYLVEISRDECLKLFQEYNESQHTLY